MCDEQSYKNATKDGGYYYPPTYEQDGFIHATAEPKLLLDVGTYFYKAVVGNWICLEIDPYAFREGTIKYESPLPVGNIEAYDHDKEGKQQPLFPHIYGGITANAVTKTFSIIRAEDGTFLSIEGIV
jgi:uncharacterized protein (DUF952 family)